MQGTSHDKIYEELELKSLKARKWYKRLSCMFEIMKEEAPIYLMNLIQKCNQDTLQYLLHCDHLNQHRPDFMNSAKSVLAFFFFFFFFFYILFF